LLLRKHPLRDGALPRAVNLPAFTIVKINLTEHFKVTLSKLLPEKKSKERGKC
jgi:hypothetical protein